MSTLLLDTNIVSDMMRNLQGPAATRAMDYSRAHGAEALCISVVVQCELEYGLRRKPNRRLQAAYENILETLTVLPIEASISPVYAQLRTALDGQGTPMGANDLLIAAQALAIGATVVSADAAFARVPGLQVRNWLA